MKCAMVQKRVDGTAQLENMSPIVLTPRGPIDVWKGGVIFKKTSGHLPCCAKLAPGLRNYFLCFPKTIKNMF